jgi:PAS domain S-box-containing protein
LHFDRFFDEMLKYDLNALVHKMISKYSLPPGDHLAYLAAIIHSSDDAIISKDLNGNITSWNPSAERIFGYNAEEAIGKHITLIIPPERLEEENQIIDTLKRGERIEHYETVRRHKNGNPVQVSITVSPIRDASGNIIGASKISRDITERIRSEEILRETSRKKEEFLANMSHELRTPMNAVIGLSNLLLAMKDLPEGARKFLDTLKISADNLMELINDLLDFARIEASSLELERVEFNLAEELSKAINVAAIKAREKELDLYVRYSPSLQHYYLGDPLRIRQVIGNLLSNAVKFTEKGSIEITVSEAPARQPNLTCVVIEIKDTGIGISEDKIPHIFDKFMQADSSITRRYGGSGLGLAICKAFVEEMGGTINVTSHPGIGTHFTVYLEFENTGKPCETDSFIKMGTPSSPRSKSVLLVEDYEPNVLVAGTMLQQMGYDYEVANNGYDALRKFSQAKYHVVLMDIQMHELDGLEATRRIRMIEAEQGLPRTPIIAMTAHVRAQDKDQCFKAGMDDFIPKPFEPSLLKQKISHYLQSKTL